MLTEERMTEIAEQHRPILDLTAFARAVEREARREALEEALRSITNGDICWQADSPCAGAMQQITAECAAAIRALIEKGEV